MAEKESANASPAASVSSIRSEPYPPARSMALLLRRNNSLPNMHNMHICDDDSLDMSLRASLENDDEVQFPDIIPPPDIVPATRIQNERLKSQGWRKQARKCAKDYSL